METGLTISKELDKRLQDEEAIVFQQPGVNNFVVMSENYFKKLQKAKNNIDFLEKLERGQKQHEQGKIVIKTWEELEAMAE